MTTYSGYSAVRFLLDCYVERDAFPVEVHLATRRRDGKLCMMFIIDGDRAALTVNQVRFLPATCAQALEVEEDDEVRMALRGLASLAMKAIEAFDKGRSPYGPH